MKKTLSVIIPAYNEGKSIGKLLDNLYPLAQSSNWKIIIVNDCSKDDTKLVVMNHYSFPNIVLINNKVNKGYGGAIKEGVMQANTDYLITIDADGQHELKDIEKMYDYCLKEDADMIVGSRMKQKNASYYRALGKTLIRSFTKIVMTIDIEDINSGIKLYNVGLAKKYIKLCPDGMSYSDVIALVFINQKHLVKEIDVTIHQREEGVSTISTKTAFQTIYDILNLAMFFNPLRLFLPLSIFVFLIGFAWSIPIIIEGKGISVGAALLFITALLLFVLGLIAEQLRYIRRGNL